MLSTIADIQKSTQDIEMKTKRRRNTKADEAKRSNAVGELYDTMESWTCRTSFKQESATPVLTTRGKLVRDDGHARSTFRKLYGHLKKAENPGAMEKEVFDETLDKLLATALEQLPTSPVANPADAAVWRPMKPSPLPF